MIGSDGRVVLFGHLSSAVSVETGFCFAFGLVWAGVVPLFWRFFLGFCFVVQEASGSFLV